MALMDWLKEMIKNLIDLNYNFKFLSIEQWDYILENEFINIIMHILHLYDPEKYKELKLLSLMALDEKKRMEYLRQLWFWSHIIISEEFREFSAPISLFEYPVGGPAYEFLDKLIASINKIKPFTKGAGKGAQTLGDAGAFDDNDDDTVSQMSELRTPPRTRRPTPIPSILMTPVIDRKAASAKKVSIHCQDRDDDIIFNLTNKVIKSPGNRRFLFDEHSSLNGGDGQKCDDTGFFEGNDDKGIRLRSEPVTRPRFERRAPVSPMSYLRSDNKKDNTEKEFVSWKDREDNSGNIGVSEPSEKVTEYESKQPAAPTDAKGKQLFNDKKRRVSCTRCSCESESAIFAEGALQRNFFGRFEEFDLERCDRSRTYLQSDAAPGNKLEPVDAAPGNNLEPVDAAPREDLAAPHAATPNNSRTLSDSDEEFPRGG